MQTEEQTRVVDEASNLLPRRRDDAAVRADEVARGKALVADPNYPSVGHMTKVANILAAKWKDGTLDARLAECANPDADRVTEQNVSLTCRAHTSRSRGQ